MKKSLVKPDVGENSKDRGIGIQAGKEDIGGKPDANSITKVEQKNSTMKQYESTLKKLKSMPFWLKLKDELELSEDEDEDQPPLQTAEKLPESAKPLPTTTNQTKPKSMFDTDTSDSD